MKKRITITIDERLLKKLDSKIKERIFASRSHAIERAIDNYFRK